MGVHQSADRIVQHCIQFLEGDIRQKAAAVSLILQDSIDIGEN